MALLAGLASIGYAQTITTFDVPNSTATLPESINPGGQIAGVYLDASFRVHGFLRKNDGTFITFDVPVSLDLNVVGITPAGQIAGETYDGIFPWLSAGEGRHYH